MDALERTTLYDHHVAASGRIDEKLAGTNVHIYGQPGNDDDFVIDDALCGEHVSNVESQVVRVGDYQLLSCA